MGLFDFIEDAVDAAIDLPGEVLEASAEIVTRLPEAGIKAVEGVVKGAEKGFDKLGESL